MKDRSPRTPVGSRASTAGVATSPQGLLSLSRDIPIKFLVVAGFLLAGLVPVIMVALFSLSTGKEALRSRAMQQLESVRSLKKAQLERFFEQKAQDVASLSVNPAVVEAQADFCRLYHEADGASSDQFLGLGKGNYQAPEDYRALHRELAPFLAQFTETHGYYDLFLLDAGSGETCFTVKKESDFAVRIDSAPTALRDVYLAVLSGAPTALSDTKLYRPSRNAAAQFVAAPIHDSDGAIAGVVALQIGLDGINEILSVRAGMGRTGETYLVGFDHRMRSDASLDPEGHSVTASFSNSLEESGIDTLPVARALAGDEGTTVSTNYRGQMALSAYSPLSVGKGIWALVAEIEAGEIEQQIDEAFNRQVLYLLGLSVILVVALGLLISAFIISQIRQLTGAVGRLGRQVLVGDLTVREVPSELGTDFRDLVEQLNSLVDSFVAHLDLLPAPLVLVDASCRVRFVNKALARVLGRPRSELLGQDYLTILESAGLRSTQPEDEENHPPLVCAAMKSMSVAQGETLLCGAQFETFFFSTAAPLLQGDGELLGAIEVLVDQTETRRMALENAALEEQLARIHRLDSLGTLASGIAHDFNNILGYLFAYADIAKGMLPPDHEAHPPLESLTGGIQRASDLVEQILVFARQARTPSKEVDLSQLVQTAMTVARAALPAGVTLQLDLQPACLVMADPSQLQQVVLNLFTNAWQAMPGGGELSVKVCGNQREGEEGAEESPSTVTLSVSDTGVGIPEEFQTRIFEPFFSQKPPGEGTGLGLSVVHGVVQKLGGSIDVRSREGSGTTFVVTLPGEDVPHHSSSS